MPKVIMSGLSRTVKRSRQVEDNYKDQETLKKEEAALEDAIRKAVEDDDEYLAKAEEKGETPGEPKKVDIKREIFSWILVVVVAYILAFCITHFVIIKTEVISSSMVSTLNVGDRVIGNRLAYLFSEPERGDIIFFAYPGDESETYVKRVIGCPGDTVKIADGKVYVNGSQVALSEPSVNGQKTKLDDFIEAAGGEITVPENSFFVMGDNRTVSEDSREWGYVTKDEIYAKAWLRYKPNLEFIKSATYE